MSYPINYPTPQRSNFQAFYGGNTRRDWVKPQGVSMVRFLLIGAGGGGGSGGVGVAGAGGSSGAVTSWIGPAMFIPDVLRIFVGAGGAGGTGGTNGTNGGTTNVIYQQKDTSGYTLLEANGGSASTGAGGTAMVNNFFGASGILTSVNGQAGSAAATNITASGTTFLSGGAGGGNTGTGGNVATKYGYPAVSGGTGTVGGVGGSGYFLFQPILISQGGAGGGGNTTATGGTGGNGGIGCGGGGGGGSASGNSIGGRGGDGAVFIWSW
jgi:hypothetical protein